MLLALHTLDSVIIIVYLLVVTAIGFWLGRSQKDLAGYFLGGRDLPWWMLLGSIVATETSTATFLSVPGISYARDGDLRFLQLAMGYIIGRCLIVTLFLPHYFRGDLFSVYEILDRRFGPVARKLASLLFLVARNLGDGLRLFLAALVLERMVGMPLSACILVLGIITIIYTVLGGMKSVVWNDCIQFVIYILGGVLALTLIVQKLPAGWDDFITYARMHDKLKLFQFQWRYDDPLTVYAGIMGGMVLTLGTHGTDQMMVQRYLCARRQADAAKALVLSGFVVLAQFSLFLTLGIGLACFYDLFPPATAFSTNDSVFAAFIVDHLPTGLVGLTLAAVFAAAMSTLSSSLNSSATAALNDFYLSWNEAGTGSDSLLKLSRVLTIGFGFLQIAVAIAAQSISTSVVQDVLAIAGFTAGILLGVFLLGVLTRRADQPSVVVAMFAGLAVVSVAKFCTNLAWSWYAVVGALTTFGVGLAVSYLWPKGHDGMPPSVQT